MIHFISSTERTFDSPKIQHNQVSKEDIFQYCTTKKFLGVDTETEGLDFLTKKVVMFQIGDNENQFVIDTRDTDIEFLRPILEDRGITKIFHNVKFDYKFIKKWYDITCENVYDTMLGERVLTCGKDVKPGHHSLEQVCRRRLDIQLDKATRNKFIDLRGRPFEDRLIIYGAQDVENLIKIKNLQMEEINSFDLNKLLDLENEVVLAFSDIEFNGIALNKDRWTEIAEDYSGEMKVAQEELDKIIISDKKFSSFLNKNVQLDFFSLVKDVEVLVNWSSPIQVLKLFKELIPTLEDVNGKNLYVYKNRHILFSKYISYKEVEKKSNAYGLDFLKYVKSDERIHTSFNQILNTGRVSSRNPNMQQIPADNKYRNCFITGKEDWVFVSSDYSSQELCIIAYGSKDPVWLQALADGKDLHSVCAELVYSFRWKKAASPGCKYYKKDADGKFLKAKCDCKGHKLLRTSVKTINFGLAYGMSKVKLADTLQISIGESDRLIKKYFKAFPKIKFFLNCLGEYGLDKGYIKTFAPYRRMRWYSSWHKGIKTDKSLRKELGMIERASKNTPIQGTGADMCKYALILIRDYIAKHKIPVKLVMAVHDQIDTIVHKDYADQWSIELSELMQQSTLNIIPSGLLKADTTKSSFWEK